MIVSMATMYENVCGNYVRKCMWQLCGWGRVDICMTVHTRAFNFFNNIAH
jgi:hypothetical protein